MDLSGLKQPFSAKQIHWRVGRMSKDKKKAIPFAFLNARDVMERLDDVCGMSAWQAEYPFPGCCRIGVRVGVDTGKEGTKIEWVWKANMADNTDIEAVKGGASDAFKRAAVLYGIGRYLYDLPNRYFPVGQYGFEDEVIAELNSRYTVWTEQYFKKQGE